MSDVTALLVAIGSSEHRTALRMLDATPTLVTARVARTEEFFLAERRAQIYEGDTARHAAAFSYDVEMARARGARCRHPSAEPPRRRTAARGHHRRARLGHLGPQPSTSRDPLPRRGRRRSQRARRRWRDSAASSRAQPCSAAVDALLQAGTDPRLEKDSGSTASDLAQWTTGRGGTGSAEAKAEQQIIIELLTT